ncbi:hypothetical protein MPSEU_000691100 [Mayamaea pseudoterrestris]|nr:hypothetical protein MPSEU_000691100 [Mayamaea pseudoterrestris]
MQDPFTEHRGCFVYLVHEPLRPRVRPCPHADYATSQRFHPGDLISVDAVRSLDESETTIRRTSVTSTSYLRLSDSSGWLPQTSLTNVQIQQVPVKTGLWKFYIDNYPVGQALRKHPIDSAEMHLPPTDSLDQAPIIYAPMQLVFCDCKVTHPVSKITWYRVQGTDSGWIVDRRLDHPVNMLLPANKVQTGLFAFVALKSLCVRSQCSSANSCMTNHAVKQGQIVTVNVIRTRPSLREEGSSAGFSSSFSDSDTENHVTSSSTNGPYLRLTDGSGWVFVRKEGMEIMRQVPIMAVQAHLEVLNHPVGLSLRRFPMDDQDKIVHKAKPFRPGTLLQADLQVTDEQGVRYYRIVGTDGWLFDRRGRDSVLKVLNEGEPTSNEAVVMSKQVGMAAATNKDGWSIEFVRGVASTIESVQEKDYHPNSQVLCFETVEQVRIDVYCNTRTIGVRPMGKQYAWYRNCSPKALRDHMSRDLVEMIMKTGMICPDDEEVTVSYMQSTADAQTNKSREEEEARNHLLRVDQEIQELLAKRLNYLAQIRVFDAERAAVAEAMSSHVEERKKEQERLQNLNDPTCDPAYIRESVYDTTVRDVSLLDSAIPGSHRVKTVYSGSDSKYSHRSKATANSNRAFSTRSNTSKPVNERIDYLLDLKSNETDDNSDAPFRKRSPIQEADATDDEDESLPHFHSEDIGEGSSFDTDPDGASFTDSDVESR